MPSRGNLQATSQALYFFRRHLGFLGPRPNVVPEGIAGWLFSSAQDNERAADEEVERVLQSSGGFSTTGWTAQVELAVLVKVGVEPHVAEDSEVKVQLEEEMRRPALSASTGP